MLITYCLCLLLNNSSRVKQLWQRLYGPLNLELLLSIPLQKSFPTPIFKGKDRFSDITLKSAVVPFSEFVPECHGRLHLLRPAGLLLCIAHCCVLLWVLSLLSGKPMPYIVTACTLEGDPCTRMPDHARTLRKLSRFHAHSYPSPPPQKSLGS